MSYNFLLSQFNCMNSVQAFLTHMPSGSIKSWNRTFSLVTYCGGLLTWFGVGLFPEKPIWGKIELFTPPQMHASEPGKVTDRERGCRNLPNIYALSRPCRRFKLSCDAGGKKSFYGGLIWDSVRASIFQSERGWLVNFIARILMSSFGAVTHAHLSVGWNRKTLSQEIRSKLIPKSESSSL